MSIRSATAAGGGGPTTDAAVGMMDGAYFTSRKDILDFFNSLLSLNLTKIEQTASGAVACQLVEYMYPNSVPLRRVNWEAKTEYEYVQNYKLLQAAFDRHHIRKHVDVDRLIRAKYQDNLEFCQWLKAFYDQAAPYPDREGGDYDPVAARSRGKGGKDANKRFQRTAGQHGSKLLPTDRGTAATPAGTGTRGSRTTPSSARTATATGGKSSSKSQGWSGAGRVRSTAKENLARNASSSSASKPPPARRKVAADGKSSPPRSSDHRSIVADANLMKKNSDLMSRNAELELTVADLERERDFYFEKLRDVELMLQIHADRKEGGRADDDSVVIGRIMKILYATSDDPVRVDDDGNLVGGGGGDDADGGDDAAAAPEEGGGDARRRPRDAVEEEDLVMDEVDDHGRAAAAALAATDIAGAGEDDDSDDDLLVDDDVLRAGGDGDGGGNGASAMDESLLDIY